MTQDMTRISGAAEAVVSALIVTGMRKATKFIGPNIVVKLTRQRRPDKRSRSASFVLTIGQPNYAERKFIKGCQRAGERLPVRKVQMRDFPKAVAKARKLGK